MLKNVNILSDPFCDMCCNEKTEKFPKERSRVAAYAAYHGSCCYGSKGWVDFRYCKLVSIKEFAKFGNLRGDKGISGKAINAYDRRFQINYRNRFTNYFYKW